MKPRAKILVTNRIHHEVADRLEASGEVDCNREAEPLAASEFRHRLSDATAVMGFMTDCIDDAALAAAPNLKVVACALKGFDSYDVEACTRAGVWVTIVPDLLTEPTAELAIGLAIGLARQVREADAYVRSGHFKGWRPQFYGKGLAGSTVAVVGMGRVGQAIVERLRGFGCSAILSVDPTINPPPECIAVQLEVAFQQADYVFVAVPLVPGSRHLIRADLLSKSKAGLHLINVGRGSVVDEDAVANSLREGLLGGYAADVFAFEDWLLDDRPSAIPSSLLSAPRTLFTPHIGSAVARVRLAIEHRAADNIIAVLAGRRPPDAINNPIMEPRR